MMRDVVGWVLRRKSVSVLATLLLVAGGAYGATQLQQETIPDVDLPLITVNTVVPGAGPETVDETVTDPVQAALEGIEGLDNVEGVSSQGISAVQVEFDYGTDLDQAETDLRSALDSVSLPEQAAEPEVEQVASDRFPIQTVSISGDEGGGNGDDEELGGNSDDDLRSLTTYVEEGVVPEIKDVEGVSGVDLVGGSERVASVELDPERMEENGVTAQGALGAINGAEVDSPVGAGRVEGEDRSTPILAQSAISSVDELGELPVTPEAQPSQTSAQPPSGAVSGAGAPAAASAPSAAPAGTEAPEPVALQDVATVGEEESEDSGLARTDEEPSLALSVTREADANTVAVAEGVNEKLDEIRDDMGDAEQVAVVSSDAENVSESVNDLVFKALLGVAVAILVIVLFLRNWRATLVAAVSLPASIMTALLLSWAFDFTLNLMTMGGLVVAIGRVVDDAIVVLENSDRYLRMGYDPEEAALLGTTEVASPITSSTLTTVAVFLPLAFVGGLVGQVFTQLALTVTFALLASLLGALTIVPVLISLFLKRRVFRGEATRGSEPEREGRLLRAYGSSLVWSVRSKGIVLFGALALFAGGLAMATQLPSAFFPEQKSDTLSATIDLPEGTTQDRTGEELRRFEEFLADDSDVASHQVQIGGEAAVSGDAPTGAIRPENRVDVTIALDEDADAGRVLDRVEEEADDAYGARNVEVEVLATAVSSSLVEATITGGSQEEREEAAASIREDMDDNAGVKDVESSVSGGAPQVGVALDPQRTADAGLSPQAAAGALSSLFGGATAGSGAQQATVDGEPIVVGVPEETLDSVEAVRELPVALGTTVGEIATVEETGSPSSVNRVDGERAIVVSGTITGQDTTGITTAVRESINDLDLPDGVGVVIGGEQDDVQEGFGNMLVAIGVAVALVYLILVAFFGSVLTPLVMLLSLPLTTAGAFGALVLTGTPLSVPVLLGILLLIGIVVANAILLVDFAEKRREAGATPEEAVIEAGKARVRPVLMTAFATVGALLPLAIGIGSGDGLINAALAIPVIGGLVTATLLTLLVIPAGYSLARGLRPAGRRRRDDGGPDGPPSDDGPEDDDPRGGPPTAEAGPAEDRIEDTSQEEPGREPDREPVGAGAPKSRASTPEPEANGASREGAQYELGRARGRIEALEEELRRRDRELSDRRRKGQDDGIQALEALPERLKR